MSEMDSRRTERSGHQTGGLRRRIVRGALSSGLAFALLPALPACDRREPPATSTATPEVASPQVSEPTPVPAAPQSPAPAEPAAAALTLVAEPNLVCMVNNQFMGKPQIPVAVDGKTYYGCCPMCKDRLANNPDARTALDPVSRKAVDKASAVMAKTGSGEVLYFESNETFAAYSRQKQP